MYNIKKFYDSKHTCETSSTKIFSISIGETNVVDGLGRV